MNIESVKGVGPMMLEYLKKLEIINIQELIEYYPYRYNIIKIISVKDLEEDTSYGTR